MNIQYNTHSLSYSFNHFIRLYFYRYLKIRIISLHISDDRVLVYQMSVIVDSSNTNLNSAWMAMGLRSVFDESTIKDIYEWIEMNQLLKSWLYQIFHVEYTLSSTEIGGPFESAYSSASKTPDSATSTSYTYITLCGCWFARDYFCHGANSVMKYC